MGSCAIIRVSAITPSERPASACGFGLHQHRAKLSPSSAGQWHGLSGLGQPPLPTWLRRYLAVRATKGSPFACLKSLPWPAEAGYTALAAALRPYLAGRPASCTARHSDVSSAELMRVGQSQTSCLHGPGWLQLWCPRTMHTHGSWGGILKGQSRTCMLYHGLARAQYSRSYKRHASGSQRSGRHFDMHVNGLMILTDRPSDRGSISATAMSDRNQQGDSKCI